jgi:signal transduction histidine kinase
MGFADAPNLELVLATLPAWWAGREIRRRRRLVAELRDRAADLEAEEAAFVALSVRHERARIARDLHDVVSHSLAVMVIQAGAGRLAAPWEAGAAAARFATIRDAGEEALADMGRLVDVLGAAPPPRLTALLAWARDTGAQVAAPPALALAPAVEAAAHRIVQEALTNALKHAPGAAIDVRLAIDGEVLSILVANARTARAAPLAATGSGVGLTGMRDRAAALGGRVDAGPDGDGGFLLRAALPLEAAALPVR